MCRSTGHNSFWASCLFAVRRNSVVAQKSPLMRAQRLRRTEKTASVNGRKGRKSAKRRKKRRKNARRSVKRRRNERKSANGRKTENGTEIETRRGTAGCAGATLTAATPVEHQTGKGADPEIAGAPGAETRRGRGNASAAGMGDSLYNSNHHILDGLIPADNCLLL